MMIKRIIRNNMRRPLYSVAVLLFAAVLAVVLCYLYQSGVEEQASFEDSYASVPVTFRVTDLDGSKPRSIEGWIVDLFGERGLQPNLAPYVGQLHIRVSINGDFAYTGTDENGQPQEISTNKTLAGVSSLYVAEELTENWGGKVHWRDGYDESILNTEESVCLVPEGMKDVQQVMAHFEWQTYVGSGKYVTRTCDKTLQVVGYYVDKGNSRLYSPYLLVKQVHAQLGASKEIEELCAVLNDNNNLAALKETGAKWFAAPNPAGDKTPWGRFGFEYYSYAMDINDTMLTNLEYSMKNSMRLNQLASIAIFFMSAGAGFLTGFLVIRSRKREIALMRTMGASHPSIFAELALEQFACIVLGIILGGSYTLWQPMGRLCLFGAIYVSGLTVALLVFLRKNLLTTIKEDE